MRNLCPLIFTLLSATVALGSNQKVFSQLQWQSMQQKPILQGGGTVLDSQSTSQIMEYRLDGLAESWNLSAGTQVSQPQYGNYRVLARDGSQQSLSSLTTVPESEVALRVGAGFSRGDHSASGRFLQTVSETPFASRRVELRAEESFFEKSTILGLDLNLAHREQPESYFIDSNQNFQVRARPTEVNTAQCGVSAEQVLTDRWKGMVKADLTSASEERPRNYGMALRQSYALAKRLFAHAGVGHRFEDQSDTLKNERGYFSLWRYDVGLVIEPIYDLLIKPTYGLMVESEFNPVTAQTTSIGSDNFGLSASYNFGEFEVEITNQFSVAQAGTSGSVSGSLLWNF